MDQFCDILLHVEFNNIPPNSLYYDRVLEEPFNGAIDVLYHKYEFKCALR